MRKGIKYALVFTGGVAVGIGVCGANLISYAYNYKNDVSYSSSDVIFESREKAQKALDGMEDILDTRGFVTVASMYDMADIPCPFTSNKYGWTSLNNAEVVRVRIGYKINLPRPLPLN